MIYFSHFTIYFSPENTTTLRLIPRTISRRPLTKVKIYFRLLSTKWVFAFYLSLWSDEDVVRKDRDYYRDYYRADGSHDFNLFPSFVWRSRLIRVLNWIMCQQLVSFPTRYILYMYVYIYINTLCFIYIYVYVDNVIFYICMYIVTRYILCMDFQ